MAMNARREEAKIRSHSVRFEAETLAIRNALKQAIQENYLKVIIESDSLVAIQAIIRKSIPLFIFVI